MVDELAVAHVLLAAVALISCLSVTNKRTIRWMPRAVWVMMIVLIPLAGSIGWFLAGRPHRIGPHRTAWRDLLDLPEPPRPQGPEDDPEFLRRLDHPTGGDREHHTDRPQDDPHRRDDGQDHPGPRPDS